MVLVFAEWVPWLGAASVPQQSARGRRMKIRNWRSACFCFALAALPLFSISAAAQILVSANDNKAVLVNGVNVVPDNPAVDTVSIIDLGVSPPKLIGEVKAPASVVGRRRVSRYPVTKASRS
jgi:hypothetical protein